MVFKTIVELFVHKINQIFPSLDPGTEEERLYEEGKKRVYALHEQAAALFYVENVWQQEEKLHLYGVCAKGELEPGSFVKALDNYGEGLFSAILTEILEERPEDVKVKRGFFKVEPKVHLVLSKGEENAWMEDYIYTNYLVPYDLEESYDTQRDEEKS